MSAAAERGALDRFERQRRAAARGLVHGPYVCGVPRTSVETAIGGTCTKLRRRYVGARHQADPPRRGEVRAFSRRSRTRLMQTLCAMPVAHVGRGVLFVTLTYPAAYPGDWRTWKRQLGAWFDRLRRRLPAAAAVWKLEPQRRGAPHFHLLIVGTPFLAREWLSRTWYEVVGSGDPKHLVAGTQVQLARSHRGVVSYAAKYTAKAQHLPPEWQGGVGRWWGVYNRSALMIEWTSAYLSQDGFWRACRVLRGIIAARQRARGRSPPRASPGGMWAVLSDTHAARLLTWLDTPGATPIQDRHAAAAAGTPAGAERSAAVASGDLCAWWPGRTHTH